MSAFSETQPRDGPAALSALVRDFDHDPVANRKRISELLQVDREVFYLTAVEILKLDAESRAAQYLIALLVSANLVFRALSDPSLDRQRAAALARHALRVDPHADTRIARQLAEASSSASGPAETGMAERVMQILSEVSDGRRILPSLLRILRNDNPYLRSKAVLMIGRSGRSLPWIKRRLQESDTRVRANAIEAIWGIDSNEARELLEWATRDSNNRVVGNALLGLYRLGETSALLELTRMAGHDSPGFRRTAAWVMGQTSDPRFTEILGRMLADSNKDVRKSAFVAVGRIRAAAAQAGQAEEWPVSAYSHPKNPRTGQSVLSVAVVGADGLQHPRVSPVQFHLSENGQPVWSYRVLEGPIPQPMSVVFLYPRRTGDAALRCLNWKRSTDLWSAVPYSDEDNRAVPNPEFEIPPFLASASQAARIFQETPSRNQCTGFWPAIYRAIQPGNTTIGGKRHLIVLATDEVGNRADDNLVAAVCASRCSLQVVSAAANLELREFCRRVEGRFHLVEDPSAVESQVSLAYLALLARYEVRYTPASDAPRLKLRIHTPQGWGETTVA